MTIRLSKQEVQDIKDIAADCETKYKGNVFFNTDRYLFSQLVQLSTTKNMIQTLQLDVKYLRLKNWLENLFQNDTSDIVLELEDRVNLVLNNITHLPGCKCRLRFSKKYV